jgi:hypothetical protein
MKINFYSLPEMHVCDLFVALHEATDCLLDKREEVSRKLAAANNYSDRLEESARLQAYLDAANSASSWADAEDYVDGGSPEGVRGVFMAMIQSLESGEDIDLSRVRAEEHRLTHIRYMLDLAIQERLGMRPTTLLNGINLVRENGIPAGSLGIIPESMESHPDLWER